MFRNISKEAAVVTSRYNYNITSLNNTRIKKRLYFVNPINVKDVIKDNRMSKTLLKLLQLSS